MFWIGRLKRLAREHGFTDSPRQGLVGLARATTGGGTQRFDVFEWSNPKAADAKGLPRAYLAICPSLDGATELGRWRVPLVEWPSTTQNERPWDEVAQELDDVIFPLMDLPDGDAEHRFHQLGDRYLMPTG